MLKYRRIASLPYHKSIVRQLLTTLKDNERFFTTLKGAEDCRPTQMKWRGCRYDNGSFRNVLIMNDLPFVVKFGRSREGEEQCEKEYRIYHYAPKRLKKFLAPCYGKVEMFGFTFWVYRKFEMMKEDELTDICKQMEYVEEDIWNKIYYRPESETAEEMEEIKKDFYNYNIVDLHKGNFTIHNGHMKIVDYSIF